MSSMWEKHILEIVKGIGLTFIEFVQRAQKDAKGSLRTIMYYLQNLQIVVSCALNIDTS